MRRQSLLGVLSKDAEMTSASEDDVAESLEDEEPNTSLQEPPSSRNEHLLAHKRQLLLDEPQVGREEDSWLNKVPTEWEGEGGLRAVEAAFEGTFLFDLPSDVITAWCTPIVWKLFLKQSLSVQLLSLVLAPFLLTTLMNQQTMLSCLETHKRSLAGHANPSIPAGAADACDAALQMQDDTWNRPDICSALPTPH